MLEMQVIAVDLEGFLYVPLKAWHKRDVDFLKV